jgi:plastocyanin
MRSPSSATVRTDQRLRALGVAAALALTLVAGACGSDGDESATTSKEAPAGAKSLSIKDFMFSPQPLEVAKGTVVKVTNGDDAAHTATANDMSFDTGTLADGESKEITLDKAGEIAFHCQIHDYMTGVIRVSP